MSQKNAPSLIKRLALTALFLITTMLLHATIEITGRVDATVGECDGSIEISATGTAKPFSLELVGPSAQFLSGVSGLIHFTDLCPGNYSLTVTDAIGCEKVFEFDINGCPEIDLPPYISSVTVYTLNGSTETKIYQAFWTENAVGNDACILFQPSIIAFPQSEVEAIGGGQRSLIIETTASVPMTYVGLNLPGISASPAVLDGDDLVWRFALDIPSTVAEIYNAGLINQPLRFVGQAQNGLDLLDLRATGGGTDNCIAYPRRDEQCNLDATYYQYGTDDVHVLSNCGLPLQANLVAANAPCDGMADGSLCIEVTGGVPPYQYLWENGSTTECAKDLATFGCYAVTVTDACGMELNTCFQLPLYEALGLHISTIEDRCLFQVNGGVDAFFTGGTPPFDYELTGANLTRSGNVNERFLQLDNLDDETYQLQITDACGLSQSRNVTVGQRVNLANNAFQGTFVYYTCDTENPEGFHLRSIDLRVDPAIEPYLTYAWSNGAQTQDLIHVPAGDYFVTITSSDGCSTIKQASVEEDLSLTETVIADCSGNDQGSISLMISGDQGGATTYLWSTGATTAAINNLALDTYCVTITTGIGCRVERCYNLNDAANRPELTVVSVDDPRINPENGGYVAYGSATFAVSGPQPPFTLSWAGEGGSGSVQVTQAGPVTVPNFQIGYHQFTLTDSQGCEAFQAVNFQSCSSFPTQILFPIGQTLAISNLMGGIIIPEITDGNPPFQYSWTGPNGFTSTTKDLSDLQTPGEYCLTVIDNCELTTQKCLELPGRCDNCVGIVVDDPCLKGLAEFNGIGKGAFAFSSIIQLPPYSMTLDLEWYDEDHNLINTGRVTLTEGSRAASYPIGCQDYLNSIEGSQVFKVDQVISGVSSIEIDTPGEYTLEIRDQFGCYYEANAGFAGKYERPSLPLYEWKPKDRNDTWPALLAGMDIPGTVSFGFRDCKSCGFAYNYPLYSIDDCSNKDDDIHTFGYAPTPPEELTTGDDPNPCRRGGKLSTLINDIPTEITVLPNLAAVYVSNGAECGCLFPPGTYGNNASIRKYGLEYLYYEWDCSSPPPPPIEEECGDDCMSCELQPNEENCSFQLVCMDDPENPYVIEDLPPQTERYKRIVRITIPNGDGTESIAQEYCEIVEVCAWDPCSPPFKFIDKVDLGDCCTEGGDYVDLPYLPCSNPPPGCIVGFQGENIPEINAKTSTVTTANTLPSQSFNSTIAPNPFSDIIEISVSAADAGLFSIKIIDALGSSIRREVLDVQTGINRSTLKLAPDLPSGLYLMVIESASGERRIHKIIKAGK